MMLPEEAPQTPLSQEPPSPPPAHSSKLVHAEPAGFCGPQVPLAQYAPEAHACEYCWQVPPTPIRLAHWPESHQALATQASLLLQVAPTAPSATHLPVVESHERPSFV